MENTVKLTGKIKNIKPFTGSKGTLVTGWFDQREISTFSNGGADREVYVVGLNIVALDESTVADLLGLSRAGTEQTDLVTLSGRLITRFDRRQDIPESQRRAPMVQFEVHAVEVN